MAPHPGLEGGPVYLDYNATTPVDPAVLAAMWPHLAREFGNPSSSHAYGLTAHGALTAARRQVQALLGAAADSSLVFTGSGSEADALAIRGAVLASPRLGHGARVITQATEHPAVLAACEELRELHSVRVTVLPVDATGTVDPQAVEDAIDEDTVLVSVMHANNETGTIQPIAQIARIAHAHGALMHTDAAQSTGKIAVDAGTLGVDLLTVVGHKVYAPKGVAALYVAPGVALRPVVGGGGQEGGLRAGTENVPYAVGLGRAAELAVAALAAGETTRLAGLRDQLHARLDELLPGRVHLNGHPTDRLPNTLNLSIDGVRALNVLDRLDGAAVSAGSACHSGQDTPSPVLTAMGVPRQQALSALRLSLGRWSTSAEADQAAERISAATRA
ncbi:MAG: cysteine desulfurase NifS [Cellulomonas sp. 73-92]|nr:MAG: cysteine desulfurase NifS [Cellulomonas sp. 73-92]